MRSFDEHAELPDESDRRCRRSWCSNSRNADRQARYYGELCDDCEREAEREDEENPRCPVCEVRKEDHDDVYPCRIDPQD